jgi:hypothetical protein
MSSVRGTIQNGTVTPVEQINGHEGQSVIITFLDEDKKAPIDYEAAWADLERILKESTIDSGIGDLAHEHDHYLYGSPKKGR